MGSRGNGPLGAVGRCPYRLRPKRGYENGHTHVVGWHVSFTGGGGCQFGIGRQEESLYCDKGVLTRSDKSDKRITDRTARRRRLTLPDAVVQPEHTKHGPAVVMLTLKSDENIK